MKAISPFLIGLAGFVFLYGCETTEKIDEFPLRPSRLVVNSYFAPDSAWAIQVSKSLSVLDNAELEYVNDASIKLYKNSVLIDSIQESSNEGWYRSFRHQPVAGEKYSIEVSTPEYTKSLFAEDAAPVRVPVSNVKVTILDSSFYRDYYYPSDPNIPLYGWFEGTCNITISDPAATENYYELSLYKDRFYYNYEDSSFIYGGRQLLSFSSDDAVAENTDSYANSLLFSDEIFNGQSYQLKLDFEDWDATFDTQYTVELVSLTRAGYLYRRSVNEYMSSKGDPFSEPVLIYGNIENGYGIFAGYSVYTYNFSAFE